IVTLNKIQKTQSIKEEKHVNLKKKNRERNHEKANNLEYNKIGLNTRIEMNRGEKNIRTLSLAMHNLNGLRTNGHKVDLLLEWVLEKNIDIIEMNETNIAERQGRYLIKKDSNYIG